jgi:translation initiation factor eIF-2B subunit alpha
MLCNSFRFARFYPLNQLDPDLPTELGHVDFGPLLPRGVSVENRSRDYTPPQYLSLLITNLGVLTPAAVSDNLIQLYSGEKDAELYGKKGLHHHHSAQIAV